jgi:hypothetical protein
VAVVDQLNPTVSGATPLTVEEATNRFLQIVDNRDLANFQEAAMLLYNAMVDESSPRTRSGRIRRRIQ